MSRAVDLLADLVRADTVARDEARLAESLAERLSGMSCAWADFEPGRGQLVARSGGDTPLTFTGHLDTVPATPADWSVDPWSAEAPAT